MRKSFDSLHALVTGKFGENPRGGAVFGFINKDRNRIKLLHWDGTGLWVHAKRLEKGTFSWPKPSDGAGGKLKLAPEALALLTDGIDLKGKRSMQPRLTLHVQPGLRGALTGKPLPDANS